MAPLRGIAGICCVVIRYSVDPADFRPGEKYLANERFMQKILAGSLPKIEYLFGIWMFLNFNGIWNLISWFHQNESAASDRAQSYNQTKYFTTFLLEIQI